MIEVYFCQSVKMKVRGRSLSADSCSFSWATEARPYRFIAFASSRSCATPTGSRRYDLPSTGELQSPNPGSALSAAFFLGRLKLARTAL